MSAPAYDAFDVSVEGGMLRVGRWTGDPSAPAVLAMHGVTANHRCWRFVAERAAVTVLAPDLRGRGRSPSARAGLARHVADLLAVLDAAGVPRGRLLGHSMGGFVASAFAAAHPDRTDRVVLVDGGLPFPPLVDGVTPEQALAATIGPAAQRLTMTFPSLDAYFDFWRPHPALGASWSPELEDYLGYDLVGSPPELRSSVCLDAVTDDSRDLMNADAVDALAAALPDGTAFLRAPYGLMGEAGLYPPELVAAHARRYPNVAVREAPEVNHYTILFSPAGAEAVVAALT